MKVTFPLPTDGAIHEYCANCFAEPVQKRRDANRVVFYCPACGQANTRHLYLHLGDHNWVDEQGELRHTSAGIFVRNPAGKYLFFERLEYPLGYAIPAGHVDNGEDPATAATREFEEEIGVKLSGLQKVMEEDVTVDSCGSGADIHRWYVYVVKLDTPIEVNLSDEGRNPVWLSLEEATAKPLPPLLQYVLQHHRQDIQNA